MVLPPQSPSPVARFTDRRCSVKCRAPPSPTAPGSPLSRLQCWRGESSGEEATPSRGGGGRSIFSLDPEERAAMFLEPPAQQQLDQKEKHAGAHMWEEPLLPGLKRSWDQAWTEGCPEREDRYVVVEDSEWAGKQRSDPQVEKRTAGNRGGLRRRFPVVSAIVGAAAASLAILCRRPHCH
ncbi:hypothetical protein BSKO_10125 [Bryopsis sp. KO-2023]|nr:hypothetical protein BSKO_10125 [Bryopsis sp. KO-2023]